MKTLFRITIVLMMTVPVCYGQDANSAAGISAIKRARRNQERASAERERKLAEAAADWRDSTKITVLEKLPSFPHRQSACLSLSNLANNSVGYLDCWQFEVLQVVGPNDLLLMIDNPDIPPIWLAGYSTDGMVDGESVRVVGMVEVKGTKSYTAADNSQATVRVVRLVSRERMAAMEAETKAKEAEAKAAAEAALYRTWTDNTEKHTFVGKFLGVKKVQVYLKRKDNGKTIDVPMNRLSKKDQKWVRDEVKKRLKANLPVRMP